MMDRCCRRGVLVVAALLAAVLSGVLAAVLCGVPIAGTRPAQVAEVGEAAPVLSQETQERWSTWMSDERVPVFQFWRDPSSGKWVAVCHIVPRVWSPQYKAWSEDARSLDAALDKVLDNMDQDMGL